MEEIPLRTMLSGSVGPVCKQALELTRRGSSGEHKVLLWGTLDVILEEGYSLVTGLITILVKDCI